MWHFAKRVVIEGLLYWVPPKEGGFSTLGQGIPRFYSLETSLTGFPNFWKESILQGASLKSKEPNFPLSLRGGFFFKGGGEYKRGFLGRWVSISNRRENIRGFSLSPSLPLVSHFMSADFAF